jgi:cell fate regulator YaaT (PSP1 superfamily)
MGKVVGISFQRGAKVYDFDAGHFVLNKGDLVIVETEHGLALGEVARPPRLGEDIPLPVAEESGGEEAPQLKNVYRLATEEDLEQVRLNQDLEKEAYRHCLERIAERKLDMNLVKVECLFDRSKIIFYFTAEGRLDFRELVRDLVARFRTRVEMRQIGVRHEAKLLGGLGSCGRELCCATFLRDFEPVSVKMAKEQNLSLNPTKISGLCGRLMCCLTYEFPIYQDLKRDMPKLGKRINLQKGLEGKVIRQNVLERKVTVILNDGREVTCTPEELAELEPVAKPAPAPPSRKDKPPSPPSEQSDQAQGSEPEAEKGGDGDEDNDGAKRGRGKRRRRKGPG